MSIKCKCGCGKLRSKFDNRGRRRYYIWGHTKVGFKFSKETLRKMSESHKGKKLSEEQKIKIGNALRGRISPTRGKKSHRKGVSFCKEYGEIKAKQIQQKMSINGKGRNLGIKHHNWKGGVTSKSNKLRGSFKWKQWREAVFKRDNYTCLHCGKRGCMLHPHHVVPVKECLELDYEDLIFDVNNGDTLCVDCHIGKGLHGGVSNFN